MTDFTKEWRKEASPAPYQSWLEEKLATTRDKLDMLQKAIADAVTYHEQGRTDKAISCLNLATEIMRFPKCNIEKMAAEFAKVFDSADLMYQIKTARQVEAMFMEAIKDKDAKDAKDA